MVVIKKYRLKIWDSTKDKKIPEEAVFVGRPAPYVNPYSHVAGLSLHKTKTAKEAVEKYREYVERAKGVGKEARRHLFGKDLVCNCGELECHALVVMELANEPAPPQNPMLADGQEKPRVRVEEKSIKSKIAPKIEKKVKYVPTFKEF